MGSEDGEVSLCCPRLPWVLVLPQEVASCPEFIGGSEPRQLHSPQLAWPPQGCEVRRTSCLPSQAVHLTQGCHRGTEGTAIGLGEPTSGYAGADGASWGWCHVAQWREPGPAGIISSLTHPPAQTPPLRVLNHFLPWNSWAPPPGFSLPPIAPSTPTPNPLACVLDTQVCGAAAVHSVHLQTLCLGVPGVRLLLQVMPSRRGARCFPLCCRLLYPDHTGWSWPPLF